MSSYTCPLCPTNRTFPHFGKYFHHITLFHQNEPQFGITCNLNAKCGTFYRTYSAYKSHIYRHHSHLFHSTKSANNDYILSTLSQKEEDSDANVELNSVYDENDDDSNLRNNFDELGLLDVNDRLTDTTTSINNNERDMLSMLDVQKSYALFILKLREEFFLPKNTTNAISAYLTTLLGHLNLLFEENAFDYGSSNSSSSSSSSLNSNQKAIKLDSIKETLSNVSKMIENVSRNDYQFMKVCQKYFNYTAPTEIIVSDANAELECAYFVPIDQTLSMMLRSQPVLFEILDHVRQQQMIVKNDDDLMFSIRDSCYGTKIDQDNLLLQLYLDDIGLTNPIGSKRDKHKMSMVYFSLEDMPDQYRSQVNFIHLVGICESKILKVDFFTTMSIRKS